MRARILDQIAVLFFGAMYYVIIHVLCHYPRIKRRFAALAKDPSFPLTSHRHENTKPWASELLFSLNICLIRPYFASLGRFITQVECATRYPDMGLLHRLSDSL